MIYGKPIHSSVTKWKTVTSCQNNPENLNFELFEGYFFKIKKLLQYFLMKINVDKGN